MLYIKKPVVIDAFQITKETRQDNSDWPFWLNGAWSKNHNEPGALFPKDFPDSDGKDPLVIFTLEGILDVAWNDYIIQGVNGEIYPCKPDIFIKTYSSMADLDGAGLIAMERKRQIEVKGWDSLHDEDYEDDVLANAGACYALAKKDRSVCIDPTGKSIFQKTPFAWPFDEEWWKPTPDDRIRELSKAGALIAAEIDRIKRLNK